MRRNAGKVMAFALAGAMCASAMPVAALAEAATEGTAQEAAQTEAAQEETGEVSLDFAALLADGTYKLEKATQEYITTDCYEISGVQYETVITNPEYQYMNIWIPAGYVNEDGTFNREAQINGFTVDTAPIVFRNNCSGWFSGSADNEEENVNSFNEMMDSGFIFIACGSRSRNADNGETGNDFISYGKAPTPIVDLKAGIRYLRLNADAIPGDTDHIFSIGGSGAGEMSTLVGATGNMSEYYPYLYRAGAAGIEYDEETGTYTSTINDDVFAMMAYYPITDIDNADIAYAWMRVNSGEDGVHTTDPFPTDADFTPFQLALQEDEANAFVDYLNSLQLKDADGNLLTLDGIRSGNYYDAILNNMSVALNAYLDEMSDEDAQTYVSLLTATNSDDETWIVRNDDGTYSITDLDGFIHNFGNYGNQDEIGTVFKRNKNIPGFDTLSEDAENNAFGYTNQAAVHYSSTVGQVLLENYDKYMNLATDEEKDQIDAYIADTLTSTEADFLQTQTYLMDAMEIIQKYAAGEQETTVASHWRIRSGTADQHTSFTIGYNTALAAIDAGIDTDYSLVWAMIHGGEQEGTSTGTFVEWANELMANE